VPDRDKLAPKPAKAEVEVWYGWQTLFWDAASLPATVVYPPLGIGTYALGGPVVHWAHGHTVKGLGSLGLRVGPPLLIGYLCTIGCDTSPDSMDCNLKFAFGGLVGVVTAITIDAAVLSYEKVPVERRDALTIGTVKLMPSVSTSRNHMTVSLGGTF